MTLAKRALQMAFSKPLGPCWEALGRLLGSLGRHFGEPLGPLEASWVVSRRFLGARFLSAWMTESGSSGASEKFHGIRQD